MRLPTTVRKQTANCSFWLKSQSQSWGVTEASPVVKSTAIIPTMDRVQGWQWKSIDILITRSSSFRCALTNQLPECGWSKAEESSSFCHAWTSQLPEWLEQGSASFVGEGHCFRNQNFRGFSGSWTVFQISSLQGATAFLTGVVDPRDDTYNFNSSRGWQDDHARACSNWLKCFFLFPAAMKLKDAYSLEEKLWPT